VLWIPDFESFGERSLELKHFASNTSVSKPVRYFQKNYKYLHIIISNLLVTNEGTFIATVKQRSLYYQGI
jgi:hypothetical protein